ncbi:DEAD/DEAH box helicase [Luteolibacter pohnpeiensis]|uniref:DEAD/DEAH box helicase n=1 Tax=Luteolibacter pohnpeiensis TaxID=454153 RepID=A0A934S5W5_9BACT|nr:DEAD/DEAH box helicase [Luteolibacter pohnpeiensis]MBK1883181.1 DEAD/DEAH box helicase [Luteolibacter pohnpeiensis]
MPNPEDIQTFLSESRWKDRFDDEILAVAQSFVGKVKNLQIDPVMDDGAHLSATIAGEETEIDWWQTNGVSDFETSCSCELGSFCHHSAALLLRAAKERDASRLIGKSSPTQLAATLPSARDLLKNPPPDLERISFEPRFELRVTREPTDRQIQLLLKSLGQKEPDFWISAEATVIYGKHRSSLRSAAPDWVSPITLENGQPALIQHDSGAEAAAAQQLRDTGLSSLQSNSSWRFLLQQKSGGTKTPDRWFPDPGRVPIDAFWHQFRGEMVERLELAGWNVIVADNVGHRVHQADPERWTNSLSPGDGGWFSLSVGFDVGGKRYDLLPILAELLENDFLEETLDRPDNGHVYAPLPDGDALRLPIGRVRRILHHLAALIDPKFPDRARLHALDAVALAGLGELGLGTPPDLLELAGKLADFSGIDPIDPAEGVQATLRDYQLAGFRWMQFLARHGLHGILADDMGLGKTLQTLTHILTEKSSGASRGLPTLVIAPTSVVPNWRAEATKFTPDLRVLVLNGPERKKYFRSIPHADLVLTSFALLQRDIDKLRAYPFHLVVLDEAQHIKNPRSKVAQAACKLDSSHRLCLSGTPVENHLGEFWSLMKFLIPGFLGTEDAFNTRFRKPIEKDGDMERNELLKERVAPLILRRTKDQVAKELPPKTELVHLIELHTAQKDLYETVRATMDKRVREAIAARGIEQSQIVFLDALLKLRQICCDPRLLPDDFSNEVHESAKLDYLTDLLATLIEEGRRILLFSQFTTMLALIEQHLIRKNVAYLKLTGGSKDRGKLVEDFQSGKIPVFLISLKAGGTGLNLTAADTVIHYDPWWNPAAEAQATDRAYRIGQDKPVFVHKLLCQETVEERIHKLQQEKAKLAAGLLANADISARLDAAAVRLLLDK